MLKSTFVKHISSLCSNLLVSLLQYLASVQLFKTVLVSDISSEIMGYNTPFQANIAKQKDLLIL